MSITEQKLEGAQNPQELLQQPKGKEIKQLLEEYRPALEQELGSTSEVEGVIEKIAIRTLLETDGENDMHKVAEAAIENLEEFFNHDLKRQINLQEFIQTTNLKIIEKEQGDKLNELHAKSNIPHQDLQKEFSEVSKQVYQSYVANGVLTKKGQTHYAGDKPRIRQEIGEKAIAELEAKHTNKNEEEKPKTKEEQINTLTYKIETAFEKTANRNITDIEREKINGIINGNMNFEARQNQNGEYEIDTNLVWQ